MKKFLLSLSAFALIGATVQPAHAIHWGNQRESRNVLDCRSGYYCTQNGWINFGGSWAHIWERMFK